MLNGFSIFETEFGGALTSVWEITPESLLSMINFTGILIEAPHRILT